MSHQAVKRLASDGNRAGRSFASSLADGMKSAGKALSVGLTAPFALAAKKGIDDAGKLQQAVANISTIKPKINTDEVFKALNQMQRRVPEAAAQLGEGLYNVFSSIDVPVKDGIALTEKFAKGALGAQTSSERFGTAVIGVMNSYKKTVKDADHISDLFFNTVNKGVVTGDQLAGALGPVTASAKAAGASMEEMFAAIAAGTKEGGDAAQNINNINNLFQKITTADAQAAIRKLGVVTTDTAGKFRPIFDVLGDLKARLAGMSQSQAANALQKIFPDAQARIGAQVLISQLDMARVSLDENKKAAGAASAAYAKMSATWETQSALFKNTVSSVFTQFAVAVLPRLTAAAQSVGPVIARIGDSFAAMSPAMQSTVLGVAGIAAAVGPALMALGSIASGLGALAGAAGLLTAPLLAVGVVVAGLVAAWTTNFGGFRDAVQPIVDDVTATFGRLTAYLKSPDVSAGLQSVVESIRGVMKPLGEYLVTVWDGLRAAFVASLPFLKEAGKFIVETFSDVVVWFRSNWPDIQKTVQVVLTSIAGFWKEHGATIIEIGKGAWETIKGGISAVVQLIAGVIKIGMKLIQGDWNGAWDALVGTVKNVGAAVSRSIQGMAPMVIAAVKLLWKGVLGLSEWTGKVFIGLGKALVQGLVNGIKAGASWVAGAVSGLAQTAIQTAKEKLGIRSPSREFMKLGAFVAQGFAQGMGAGLARIAQAGAAMALAAQSGFASVDLRAGEGVQDYIARLTETMRAVGEWKAERKKEIATAMDPDAGTAAYLGLELSVWKQLGAEVKSQIRDLKFRAELANGNLIALPKGVSGPPKPKELTAAGVPGGPTDREREGWQERAKAAADYVRETFRANQTALIGARSLTNVEKLNADLKERGLKIGWAGYANLYKQAATLDQIAAREKDAAVSASQREAASKGVLAGLAAENRYREAMLDVQKRLGGKDGIHIVNRERIAELTKAFTQLPAIKPGGSAMGTALNAIKAAIDGVAVGTERAKDLLQFEKQVAEVERLRDVFRSAAEGIGTDFRTSLGRLVKADFPGFFSSLGGLVNGFVQRLGDAVLQSQIDRIIGGAIGKIGVRSKEVVKAGTTEAKGFAGVGMSGIVEGEPGMRLPGIDPLPSLMSLLGLLGGQSGGILGGLFGKLGGLGSLLGPLGGLLGGKIFGRAAGGYVEAGTLYRVNEPGAGTELLMPNQSGYVQRQENGRRGSGGMTARESGRGGNTYNIKVENVFPGAVDRRSAEQAAVDTGRKIMDLLHTHG